MSSSRWALIQGELEALLPPLPGLPRPLSVAECATGDVLVTGTSCEHPALIRDPGWLLCCSSGSGSGTWSPSSVTARDWPSTASSSCQVLGLMAAEPARLVVCSHLGSGTATLRGPEHHQALPWQGALQGLAVPPRAGTALTCPLGLFGMSLLLPRKSGASNPLDLGAVSLPRNSRMPNALQAELNLLHPRLLCWPGALQTGAGVMSPLWNRCMELLTCVCARSGARPSPCCWGRGTEAGDSTA